MKKLVLVVVVAVVGVVAYKKWSESQRDNDVWAQATDPVAPRDLC